MKWHVKTLDFTAMFLQDGMLEREIFLIQLPDVCPESKVWKLKRCIYESNDALHSQYKRVNHEVMNLKGIVSAYDNALFLWHDAVANLMGILVMHVNDFIFNGKDPFQTNVISEYKRIIKVGTHENGSFKFFRLGTKQTKDGVTIHQNLYASSISLKDNERKVLKKNDELSQEEKTDKKLTGWSNDEGSHSDSTWCIIFDVCRIHNTGKSSKVKLLFKANKSLLKLKSKTGSICFPQLG